MSSYTYIKKRSQDPARISIPGLIAGFMVTILAGFLLLTFVLTIGSANRVLTGVAVNGIDLSGMSLDEANSAISSHLPYSSSGKIVLVYGDQSWLATPAELGLFLDAHTSAQNAMNTGRSGDPISSLLKSIQARMNGYNLPPAMIFDEHTAQQYLLKIAAQIDRPVIEAGLGFQGVEVTINPSQTGRKLNIENTLKVLSVQLQTLQDGVVPIIVSETPPLLADAAPLAESARSILSAPLVLTIPDAGQGDPGPWTIDPAALARVITIQPNSGNSSSPYKVGLDGNALRGYLEGIAPTLDRTPANAHFSFNDDTRQLDLVQNAVSGRSLNVEASFESINSRLAAGEHSIPLELITTQAKVADNATAQDLGITKLLYSETSYFYGSSAARISNIRTAAANFHGLLVAPGEEFSMASAMKDVTLDNGYTEALIIFGNQTIKGVGGGVCQVSTTLFRTAFFSGFPITERYAHAYRVGYYEQTASGASDPNLAGLDATVFIPVVDLKFTNDTPYWLLMETYVTDSSITWKFYSTPDGRSVEWHNDGLQNVVPAPKPLYKENPELAKDQIKQVDWSADGADIHVSRTVYKDGQIYFQDVFDTHYAPWQAVYEYGPGTKLPKKAVIATP
jgi:vancomycin resistance protein YoaR